MPLNTPLPYWWLVFNKRPVGFELVSSINNMVFNKIRPYLFVLKLFGNK
jgi:hypothetical protein